MNEINPESYSPGNSESARRSNANKFRIGFYLLGTLLLFVFAIFLMVAALDDLGPGFSDLILLATANPFTGLFIGLLITAILQSSSTTTSLVVAFVAAGSMPLQGAVPIIMGANIGTTITSTIVSLGFINKKKEFFRAVTAGTYHDFFNILTALILFPLEYYYNFLTRISTFLAGFVFAPGSKIEGGVPQGISVEPMIGWTKGIIPGAVLIIIAVVILFSSILLFRRFVSSLLNVKRPEFFSQNFLNSPVKSFAWGIGLTALIRSSTITTSLVVPLVAKEIVPLRIAAPFVLGANIGTTVTALIAGFLYPHSMGALVIGFAHLTFNLIGVLIFFPIKILREVPLALAEALANLCVRYRISGFIYILTTFFIIPFLLIAIHKQARNQSELINMNGLHGLGAKLPTVKSKCLELKGPDLISEFPEKVSGKVVALN